MSDKSRRDGDERLRDLIAIYVNCVLHPEIPRDEAAERELFVRTWKIAYPVFLRVLRSEDDATEETQKLNISLAASFTRKQPTHPTVYIEGAAQKRANTAYRRRAKAKERAAESDVEQRGDESTPTPEQALAQRDDQQKGAQKAQRILERDDLQALLYELRVPSILERSNTWKRDDDDAPHTAQARTLPQLASVFAKLDPNQQMAFLLAARTREAEAVLVEDAIFPNETHRADGGVLTAEQKQRRRGAFEQWRTRVRKKAKVLPQAGAKAASGRLSTGRYEGVSLVQVLIVEGHELGLSNAVLGLIFSVSEAEVVAILAWFYETKGKQS